MVENVAGEIAKVRQSDNWDVSFAEWRCKDARAIVENLGHEVATIEHFGVGTIGENGPLEGVSLSGEGLGREPVNNSTFAIIMPTIVLKSITNFLETIIQ